MTYISLLEAAARRNPFRLHPGLDPEKYHITDNMRDAPKSWKAYTFEGFTATDPKNSVNKGQMATVGYVMISLVDDTIVPISRGDEHHRGYDLLSDLSESMWKKKKIHLDTRDFIPIWSYGTNYIYGKNEIPNMLTALTKFLSYGGQDGPLQGTYEMRDLVINSSDFVASGGKVNVEPDKLAPLGQKVFEGFVNLAKVISEARTSGSPSAVGKAYQTAIKFAASLRTILTYLAISDYEILSRPEILATMKKNGDLDQLEKAFFGFHGVKNNIHNALREYLIRQKKREKNYWKDDQIKALWGDVSLAVDKLGTI